MSQPPAPRADLAVTALYTSHTWLWAGFDGAELLTGDPSRRVFGATNRVMALARWLRPDAPSLPHSLAQRHQVLDHLVARAGCPQILELAAGLSPRGVALSADPAVRCTEVDLPEVIAYKREQLGRTAAGREALARPNLALVAGDVATAELDALVDPATPVCVIAEGLLMYLRPEAQRALWDRLGALLTTPGSVLLFDLTPAPELPQPGRVGRALGWLMRRFTRGRGMERDDRDRARLVEELAALGLHATSYDPRSPPADLPLGWTEQPTQFVVWEVRRSGDAVVAKS